jgi:hypothetical protein
MPPMSCHDPEDARMRPTNLGRRLAGSLTYANVTASLALFIALGGVGYAATLPRDSVGTRQIRKGAVTEGKLHRKVRAKLDRVGRTGPAGRQGPAGAAGTAGPVGPAGPRMVVTRRTRTETISGNSIGVVTTYCAKGETVLGGGWSGIPSREVRINLDQPEYYEEAGFESSEGWIVGYDAQPNGVSSPFQFTVTAICGR